MRRKPVHPPLRIGEHVFLHLHGDEYIVARPQGWHACLIDVNDGNRWNDGVALPRSAPLGFGSIVPESVRVLFGWAFPTAYVVRDGHTVQITAIYPGA